MRPYRYARSYERDARREERPARPPVDDGRQPFPLILGKWVQWEIRPYKRHVRQWWAVDADGEPIRNADGAIVRQSIDKWAADAAKRAPRRILGVRTLL
jgi:hypothetical protein